jgi:hypothetical protein
MTLRRVLSLLCVALSATALVGCAGDTLTFDPVANAASKTVDSTSARVAFAANMNIDGVGAMSFSGTGIYDGRSKSGAFNMEFNMPGAMQTQLGGKATMEMIFDGSDAFVMYIRSPLFKPVANGSWVKMDLEKLAEKEGVDLSALMNANQADPSQSLRMLMASNDARVVDYAHVRGVLTTHYKLEIDLKRLAKENKALRKSLDQLRDTAGIESFPAEAWIDDQGHVRRIKVDMSVNSPMGGAFTMTMTEDLYDFGVKATIQPPPASQVVDMSSLTGSG